VTRDRLISEIALIPKQAFVVEERFLLRVPVAGNPQRWRLAEVVLQQAIAAGLRHAVEEKSILANLTMEVIKAAVVGIDDVVPVSVEAFRVTMIGIDQHGGSRLCLPFPPASQQKYQHASNETTVHDNSLIKKEGGEWDCTHPPPEEVSVVSDLRRFVPVTLVDIEAEVWDGRHPSAQPLREFDLEGQAPSQLDNALRARRGGDLAVGARREACGGVRETHDIEDIRGLRAKL
jgi:hypothetical protein